MKVTIQYYRSRKLEPIEINPDDLYGVIFTADDGREIDVKPRPDGVYITADGIVLIQPVASNAVEIHHEPRKARKEREDERD